MSSITRKRAGRKQKRKQVCEDFLEKLGCADDCAHCRIVQRFHGVHEFWLPLEPLQLLIRGRVVHIDGVYIDRSVSVVVDKFCGETTSPQGCSNRVSILCFARI